MSLKSKIENLIKSNREGDYWDFKQEPHENNASLLHDILCLSNSLHSGERFLIYGISDPKEETRIIGLTKKQNSRKTQADLIDFLRTLSFAGDHRPEIKLCTIEISQKEIDVLVMSDNPLKPYYLTEDYKKEGKYVKANFIYTRSNDTNTPINKSADIGIIEKMWRQRFGLDLAPLKRMKLLLLRPKEWSKDIDNKSYAYHQNFPEFRIEFSFPKKFSEPYSFFFTNEASFLGVATFKWHATTLFEHEYMFCDEMRLVFPIPETEHVRLENNDNWFYSYNLENINGIFLYFLTDGLVNIDSRGSGFPFVIFDNEAEKKDFMHYLEINDTILKDINPSHHAIHAGNIMMKEEKRSIVDVYFVDKIVQLHKKWTKHNKLLEK